MTESHGEMTAEQIRRVLVATGFDYCDELFWREDDGVLRIFAQCSDWFEWGCADVEPIETEEDVALLETCLRDLRETAGTSYPMWLTELYASRRRGQRPAQWFLSPTSKHYIGDEYVAVFGAVEEE